MYLYIFHKCGFKKQEVTVNSRGFINGTVPFEDFGDALLFDTDIPVNDAFDIWCKHLKENMAEERGEPGA